MKIAIVTPYGAEPRLDNFPEFILATGLRSAGYEVRFFTYRKSDIPLYRHNLSYQGLKVFRCRQRFGLSPGLFFSILIFRPQVVMYFHPKSLLSFSAYLGARACGAKTISEIVGILHDPFIVGDPDNPEATLKTNPRLAVSWKNLFAWRNLVTHLPIYKADTIVATSKTEQQYITRFYGRDSTVIPLAVPQPGDPRPATAPANSTAIPHGFLLFIGQVKKRKGWDTVLESLAHLKGEGIIKHLVFVCPNPDLSRVKKYADELGVNGQIYYFSGVSNEEKNWLYEQCSAVLAPSRYESFGLPVFEAMAAGKPVLTADLPLYRELLAPNQDALVSASGDGKGLAANIKALDGNQELARRLVASGLQAAARFTKEKMIDRFLELITKR